MLNLNLPSFPDCLTGAYLQNPCRVLPNALWKSLDPAGQFQVECEQEQGRVKAVHAWKESALLVFWEQVPTGWLTVHLDKFRFALLHEDDLHFISAKRFAQRTAYFRLIHRYTSEPAVKPVPGFRLEKVDPSNQLASVAELIGRCYETIHPSEETVHGWSNHRVYDPELWVWAWDEHTGQPAGLGIAEADRRIGEGSLEWIQVLPEYRGRGMGRLLVQELLSRLGSRAGFVTVSGEVDNKTNPESLYRACGFTGIDIWWALRD